MHKKVPVKRLAMFVFVKIVVEAARWTTHANEVRIINASDFLAAQRTRVTIRCTGYNGCDHGFDFLSILAPFFEALGRPYEERAATPR